MICELFLHPGLLFNRIQTKLLICCNFYFVLQLFIEFLFTNSPTHFFIIYDIVEIYMDMILPAALSFPIFIVCIIDHAYLDMTPCGDITMLWLLYNQFIICVLNEEFPVKYVHYLLKSLPVYLCPAG
jgi:hypothetical protein